MLNSNQEKLFNLIYNTRKMETISFFREWIENNGCESAIDNLIEPVFAYIGELWNDQFAPGSKISIAQAYFASKIAEEFYKIITDEKRLRKNHERLVSQGIIIIGNAEDDYHSLGRKIVSSFLILDNWDITDMGNDVLAQKFVDMAEEKNARIIAVSAMMYTTGKNIIKVRNEIDKRNLTSTIKLIVGGAIFNLRKELVKEFGADGYAGNAIESIKVMKNMRFETKV